MADSGDSKIFVDDDWKEQARKEKARLAEQEKAEAEKKAAKGAGSQGLPPASFEILVNSFATQAMMAMGMIKHPSVPQQHVNLEMAKFNIDLLSILEEKTKGNLSADEAKMIDQVLYQLRMVFVEVSTANAGPIGGEAPQK